MKVLGLVMLISAVAATDNYFRIPSPYRFICNEGKCSRELLNAPLPPPHPIKDKRYSSLAECNLVCGKYGSLWPYPTKEATLANGTIPFLPQNVKFTLVSTSSPRVKELLHEQAHYFIRNLHFLHPDYHKKNKGPFTEYQGKYNNHVRDLLHYEGAHHKAEELKPSTQFLLSKLGEMIHNLENQKQGFQNLFNNQDGDSKYQMRYESVSPFINQHTSPLAESQKFNIEISVSSSEARLSMGTDESYELMVHTNEGTTTATILAATYYGARHAMESLSQLIAYDGLTNSLQVVKTAKISDAPVFKYRGIMLDTGRNFYPMKEIMALLDTMATNKLNTFHWHISDATSFPMYSLRQPQMTYYGAYSPKKVYYPQDIHDIVDYANQRGIRVIPELDAPAHAGAGWNFGEKEGKGKLVLCHNPEDNWFEYCNEAPCGQLNPANPEVYDILKNVYSDILEAFNPEMLHMGGDVSFDCWSKSPEISTFLDEQNRNLNRQELFKLWQEFQKKAFMKLSESVEETGATKVKPMIYSSSPVKDFLTSEYIVQITDDVNSTTVGDFISKGFSVVFSNADVWNFEGAAPSWLSKEQTYKRDIPQPCWKQVYENSPLDKLTSLGIQNANLVLGGEAMVWSYQTDAESLQSTVWPRGAALAERLWADPIQTHFQADKAENRMAAHRERMVNRGTRAEVFQPEYCFQNQNTCYTQDEYQTRQTHNSRPQA